MSSWDPAPRKKILIPKGFYIAMGVEKNKDDRIMPDGFLPGTPAILKSVILLVLIEL